MTHLPMDALATLTANGYVREPRGPAVGPDTDWLKPS
jgi:hypothetical protein